MYKKIFVDPEIFIDTNDRDRKNYNNSLNALYSLIENGVQMYTSSSLINSLYNILSKSNIDNAILSIQNINKFARIIDISNANVTKACKLLQEDKNFISLEYTIHYILAKKERCKLILSNNKNFYANDIEVLSAKKFCESMNEE
jgi:predicted nucleic acid-binding protein